MIVSRYLVSIQNMVTRSAGIIEVLHVELPRPSWYNRFGSDGINNRIDLGRIFPPLDLDLDSPGQSPSPSPRLPLLRSLIVRGFRVDSEMKYHLRSLPCLDELSRAGINAL
jgi:hypothetical protein